MQISITRLGGSTSYRVNDGPIRTFTPENETVILSVDGEEVDHKTVKQGQRCTIRVEQGEFSLQLAED